MKCNEMLKSAGIKEAEAEAMVKTLTEILTTNVIKPTASNDDNEYWYQMTSLRSSNLYVSAEGASAGVTLPRGEAYNGLCLGIL